MRLRKGPVMATRNSDPWAVAMAAETLAQAHGVVGRLVPAPDAAPSEWKAFHRRSVRVYERIADVDRAHHHEALYWIARERARGARVELSSGGASAAREWEGGCCCGKGCGS